MKKTILIVSIIIVCGLAIFGIVKLTPSSDNASDPSNSASTISTEAPATNSTNDVATSSTVKDNSKDNAAKDTSSKDNNSSKDTTDKKTNAKGDVVISIGSASATEDETFVVPLTVDSVSKNGVASCNFNIKYDKNALEVVDITAGDITKNIESNLEFANIESTGMISYLFTCSNSGKDAITKPGVLSNIKFKVKKDAPKGKIELTNGTNGAFGDNSLNKITATFNNGEIVIK